ncbi:MAG TPA: orotidine-5'-phosphate decarboxylase, partial [Nitrospirales bacterium]|nr:orotidine-5'-phosphate decarboxylase [Nitrospirales bacterium]
MAIEPRERLILALDVPSADEAKRLLDRVGDGVTFVKIGLELFTAAGPDIVRWALAQRKRVFLDLKLLDIGETVKRATAAAAELGVTFLTVHASSQTVRAAVEGRSRSTMKILAVTVLTSLDEADLLEMGIVESVHDTVLRRARLAISLGADGVVASGVEAAMIRRELGK